jgi:simple sugar transport system ATP-binding protein
MLAEFGLEVNPQTEIRYLGLGQRQRVEIIKALLRGSRVLLLDEPTSVLTPGEVDSLLDLLRSLRSQGVAVVLITHKLGEALAVSDRVSILRAGRNAGELGPDALRGAAPESVRQRIVQQMFGGAEPVSAVEGNRAAAGEVLFSLQDVSTARHMVHRNFVTSRWSCVRGKSSGSLALMATGRRNSVKSLPGNAG